MAYNKNIDWYEMNNDEDKQESYECGVFGESMGEPITEEQVELLFVAIDE